MSRYMYVILLILITTIVEAYSQYNLKMYNNYKTGYYFLIGALGYLIIAGLLTYSYNFGKMGIINVIWNIGSTILILLIGYFYFSEKLTTLQLFGVILAIVGLILMNFNEY